MHTVKEAFATEGTEPLLSKQKPHVLWREPLRWARRKEGSNASVFSI